MLTAGLSAAPVDDEAEIEPAFARSRGGGLIAATDLNARRALIVALAEKHRPPVIYSFKYPVRQGGLISCGRDALDIVRRLASYVDRVLRGGKPADLPVQRPTKFSLVNNLKAAKAPGLTVPPLL